jgi:putative aldouronate transport system permease protein
MPDSTAKNKIRRSAGDRVFDIFNVVLMLFLIFVTLYPLLYVVFSSLSDPAAFVKARGLLFHPAGFSLEAYSIVLKMQSIIIGFRNTIFYMVAGTAVNMVFTILGAYALSRKGFLLRKPIMMFLLVTMFVSGGMIPTFLVVQGLKMTNTIWAVLIPGAISTYNLIILRTSFESIPQSLIESAEIDGATHFTVMARIVLPLSGAALATITLFYAMGRWGDWYSALVYLGSRRDLYPLQMFLREILVKGEFRNESDLRQAMQNSQTQNYMLNQIVKYAVMVVSTVPALLVYPFLQRYFVKGVMIGAIKE